MKRDKHGILATWVVFLIASAAQAQSGGGYDLTWNSMDGGGETLSAGGGYELGGTLGQADAGVLSGGGFELSGGFWPGAALIEPGTPAATIVMAISRMANAGGANGFCDLPLLPDLQSEPRQGGIAELRIAFDVAPGGPGAAPVSIEEATCAAPDYAVYSGASETFASVEGDELVLTFVPALENARTYRIAINESVTSAAGQAIEISGLVGDVNSDGRVNGTDRSVVVAAWTGGGFSCLTDLNRDGATNATDRSVVVGAWTGAQNCAP